MWRKKLNKKNINEWIWLKCRYIWKIDWISRIVLYEGTILEDLWDQIKCEMVDRYIYSSDDLFEITLPKKWVVITK